MIQRFLLPSNNFYLIFKRWRWVANGNLPSNHCHTHGHLSHCHQNYDNHHNITWNINLEYWSIIFIIIITTILIIGQWDKHHPQAEPGKNGAEGKVGAGFLTFLSIFLSSFIIITIINYDKRHHRSYYEYNGKIFAIEFLITSPGWTCVLRLHCKHLRGCLLKSI